MFFRAHVVFGSLAVALAGSGCFHTTTEGTSSGSSSGSSASVAASVGATVAGASSGTSATTTAGTGSVAVGSTGGTTIATASGSSGSASSFTISSSTGTSSGFSSTGRGTTSGGLSGSSGSTGCETNADCHNGQDCFAPGAALCGICEMPPTTCTADSDCTSAGEVCEPDHNACDCTQSKACQAPCGGDLVDPCAPDRACQQNGHCGPIGCAVYSDCPDGLGCVAGQRARWRQRLRSDGVRGRRGLPPGSPVCAG